MQFITITIFAVASRLVSLAAATPIPDWKAGGIAIPLTRPSSFLDSNDSIDLDAISSHGLSIWEKILIGLDNYEMNTGTIHPFAVKWNRSELGTRGATSVPLTTNQHHMWMSEISIGTPPKTLKVHIDTGAADMWVLQSGCSGISEDRDLWDPNSSQSAVKQPQPFRIKYGDGTIIEGDRYTDNVTIGGFTSDLQTFGSATSYCTSPLRKKPYQADGVLGLAFPSISGFRAYPLLVSLVRQNRLTNLVFSLKLSSSGAEMYIGGANSELYNGNIVYTPVTKLGLWQVSMDDVRLNGDPILKNVPIIFDTGANYIFGDWNQVSELFTHLGGKVEEHSGYGFYYLPCDSFPTISFTFGGKTFKLPPEVLKLRPVAKDSPDCFSSLVARRAPYGFWSIGIPFLQGVYTVFDYSAFQVGLADLA